jgi:hypothetical protein
MAAKSFNLKEAELVAACILNFYSVGDYSAVYDSYVKHHEELEGEDINLALTRDEWIEFMDKFDRNPPVEGYDRNWMTQMDVRQIVANHVIEMLKDGGWTFDHPNYSTPEPIPFVPDIRWKDVKMIAHYVYVMLIGHGTGEETYDSFVSNPKPSHAKILGTWRSTRTSTMRPFVSTTGSSGSCPIITSVRRSATRSNDLSPHGCLVVSSTSGRGL